MRIKPLRDTMVREAAYYCHLRGLDTWSANGWDMVESGGAGGGEGKGAGVNAARGKSGIRSLERLTEGEHCAACWRLGPADGAGRADFVNGLMSTHPSTVSTITRTGSKLQFRGGRAAAAHACPFCGLWVTSQHVCLPSLTLARS